MPAKKKQARIPVACPQCGHVQEEPSSAISTNCKKCQHHYQVQDVLHPEAKPAAPVIAQNEIICFQCGTALSVPAAAQSTMCKRCSGYVDLKDYRINSAVSKNFKTHGRFVVEEKGYVFNTEVVASDAVLMGKFLGKITAKHTLTIHSSAEIKGSFNCAKLIIPEGNKFHWKEIAVDNAEISGELVTDLRITGTAHLKATARFFGDIQASNLIVDPGAIIVGSLKIGTPKKQPDPRHEGTQLALPT